MVVIKIDSKTIPLWKKFRLGRKFVIVDREANIKIISIVHDP